MEVVRDNFADILPEALRAIDEADFVAVDLELTGAIYAPLEAGSARVESDVVKRRPALVRGGITGLPRLGRRIL